MAPRNLNARRSAENSRISARPTRQQPLPFRVRELMTGVMCAQGFEPLGRLPNIVHINRGGGLGHVVHVEESPARIRRKLGNWADLALF